MWGNRCLRSVRTNFSFVLLLLLTMRIGNIKSAIFTVKRPILYAKSAVSAVEGFWTVQEPGAAELPEAESRFEMRPPVFSRGTRFAARAALGAPDSCRRDASRRDRWSCDPDDVLRRGRRLRRRGSCCATES